MPRRRTGSRSASRPRCRRSCAPSASMRSRCTCSPGPTSRISMLHCPASFGPFALNALSATCRQRRNLTSRLAAHPDLVDIESVEGTAASFYSLVSPGQSAGRAAEDEKSRSKTKRTLHTRPENRLELKQPPQATTWYSTLPGGRFSLPRTP